MGVLILITGVWLVFWSFILNSTGDNVFLSKMVFKIIPFFLGVINVTIGAKMIGWL